MEARKNYEELLQQLKAAIESHKCPTSGRASMAAFCEEYGLNRSNLVRAFSLQEGRDMSLGLFIRIARALGKMPQPTVATGEAEDPEVLNVSLDVCMRMQPAFMQAVLNVALE